MSVGEERCAQIVEAAMTCFVRTGYQRTTVDEIARQATISRPAIYQYFDGKPAIFRAVVSQLHEASLAEARRRLGRDGPLVERLAGAFRAKYSSTVVLVGRSSHAVEFFDSNDRIAGDLISAAQATLERALQTALRQADANGEVDLRGAKLSPIAATRLIDHAVRGVVDHALTVPLSWPGELDRLVAVLVAGLRSQSSSTE